MISLIVKIKVKTDAIDLVTNETLKLAASTTKEDGCISYDFHQDNQDPDTFFFYENWTDENALQSHLQAAHMKAYLANTKNKITDMSVHKLTKLT